MALTQIAVHIRGDVVILDPTSRICLCDDKDGLPPVVTELLERGFLKFLLNLHRVAYIDSTGVSGIVQARAMVARKGGKLNMFNVSQRIRKLFDLMKLASGLEFEVFDSEEAALRNFEGTVPTPA